ncbi:MAG: TFIIB-type zinc ribbon-containing protein [Planctomycetota bacterium]|jgi:Zn-finger nucleic acid-binding protein
MLCPSCKQHTLDAVELPSGPSALACDHCGGVWIPSSRYWAWLEMHGAPDADASADAPPARPNHDSTHAKLCPDCGHITIRYQVGEGVGFAVDHCDHCNGVWLDRGEWDALVAADVHGKLNQVFTSRWQARRRRDEAEAMADDRLAERLGAETFEELERVTRWISEHPDARTMLAHIRASIEDTLREARQP